MKGFPKPHIGLFVQERALMLDGSTESGLPSIAYPDAELGALSLYRQAPPRGDTAAAVVAHWPCADGGPRAPEQLWQLAIACAVVYLRVNPFGSPPLYLNSLGVEDQEFFLGGAGNSQGAGTGLR